MTAYLDIGNGLVRPSPVVCLDLFDRSSIFAGRAGREAQINWRAASARPKGHESAAGGGTIIGMETVARAVPEDNTVNDGDGSFVVRPHL